MNDNEFNTFDIERELEKKCNRLIGGKNAASNRIIPLNRCLMLLGVWSRVSFIFL